MKFQDFMSSWQSVQKENQFHRTLLVGLVTTNILSAIAVLGTDKTLILVPPSLQKEAELARSEASGSLKESWGLYLAELMGNVTPANAEFIAATIGPLLAPGIYRSVTEALSEQIHALKVDRIAVSFRPRQVFYEKETDRVFVTGDHISQGPNSHPDIRSRTYEFRILFRDYRPLLDSIDVYADDPRTIDHQPSTPPPVTTTRSPS